jgi:hypothetical protein
MKIDVKKSKCKDQISMMNERSYSLIRIFLNENNRKKYDKK